MSDNGVQVVLGTMLFGQQVDEEGSIEQLKLFAGHPVSHGPPAKYMIDTARNYGLGICEILLGKQFATGTIKRGDVLLATKVNAFQDQGLSLSAQSVEQQVTDSLRCLQVSCIDLLYLHAPDYQTPLEETLAAVNRCHVAGKFTEFGLSNYPAWQVALIHTLCTARGWVKPTVYQGMYNALTRDVERELLPCLRQLGVRFYAYNPLAGGLLTGRYSESQEAPQEGRFSDADMAQRYKARFWHDGYFEAMAIVKAACDAEGVTPAQAALRWLVHHSGLRAGDAVMVGASRSSHLQQNLDACASTPLPPALVSAFEQAWSCARPICPPYFR